MRVTLPRGVNASRPQLTAGRRNVTRVLRRAGPRRFIGLVRRLHDGRNRLTALIQGGGAARLVVTNHPIGGPVFAGPQIQPWTCQSGARDSQCDQPRSFKYFYLPKGASTQSGGIPGTTSNSSGGPFQPYDPNNPPSADSIATTTTTEGVTVPFIVRLETGYLDRDQYAIAALFDPGKPWKATAPQRQYNHRLVITHGFSCDTAYETGEAPSVLVPKVLGGGFIVMSHALDHAGHNCNLLTQAESLVMTKEYAIDHYGTVRWTIGSGCSGGSLAQQQVANAYPGVYQGIIPQCSFPDAWSSAMQYEEYYFGLKFLQNPARWGPGVIYDPVAISAFLDHPNISNPITFTTVIPNSGDPSRSCPGVPDAKVYDAQTNPDGVRCTLQDYMVNAFGRDKRGWARRGFDNVGIQYGLKGLADGQDLGRAVRRLQLDIGGADLDLNLTQERTAADPIALRRLYRTGAIDSANNLDKVAIIDLRGPDPGAFHDVYRTYALRARLMRNFGTAANQVLWRGQVPLVGDPSFADEAVFAMDRWLARVHADRRRIPLARKIIGDKPGSVSPAARTATATTSRPRSAMRRSSPTEHRARAPAGPLAEDVMKCQLKPMVRERLPGDLHRPAVEPAAAGLPRRRMRLQQAGGRPGGHGFLAHLPGQPGPGDLRREAAGPGAGLAPRCWPPPTPRLRCQYGPGWRVSAYSWEAQRRNWRWRMAGHAIGTREEWQAARDELAKLEGEQAQLNEGDQEEAARAALGSGREGVRVRHRGRQEDPRRALRRPLSAARLQRHVRPGLREGRLSRLHQPRR